MGAREDSPAEGSESRADVAVEPLIHIGYAKAASSWTQHMFAAEDSGFRYPLEGMSTGESSLFFMEQVVFPNALDFDADDRRTKVAAEVLREDDDVPVITSERLVGHWYSGGYDTKEIAERLHSMFPDGRVLVVFREQKAMLSSVYRQYVRQGGGRSLDSFLHPPRADGARYPPGYGRGPGFSPDFFEYDRVIGCYQELFGPDNVLAVPLEVLKFDTPRYVETVMEFAGAEAGERFDTGTNRRNEGISAFDARLRRRLNPLMNPDYINDYGPYHTEIGELASRAVLKVANALVPGFVERAAARRLDRRIEERIGDRYRESNRRTNELVEFDLGDLGYDL